MWYFTWIIGIAMAIMFAVLNAMWFESQQERGDAE